MKLIQSTAIGVCVFLSISSARAQQTGNDTTTKFTPPVIEKDSVQKSENKKEAYKSKEWQQGNEVVTDTSKTSAQKPKFSTGKSAGKSRGVPPPPPPPPPAKPSNP